VSILAFLRDNSLLLSLPKRFRHSMRVFVMGPRDEPALGLDSDEPVLERVCLLVCY
jgi:hypothetical protein